MRDHQKQTEECINELVGTMNASPFKNPVSALIPLLGMIALNLATIADALEEAEE